MTARGLPRCLLRLWVDAVGASAVEFAVLVPVLLFMAVATTDLGLALYTETEVQGAAQAGARYAAVHGYQASAILGAVKSATNLGSVSVSSGPTEFCGCASGTGVSAATCGSTCSDGSTAATYVSLSARASYSTLIQYPLIPSSFTFTSSAMVRIQ